MRRQLRANGGITNLRQGYGFGDFVRKLIPNELANIAVKAAPFVAPFNPGIAAAMRGIGRYDQRGNFKDALKQAAGTFVGGKVLGEGMEAFNLAGEGGGGGIKTIDKIKNIGTSALDKVKEIGGKVLTKPSTAKDILLNQAIIGGAVTIGSLITQGLINEPVQQQGESETDFMLRRKKSVSKQLKTYLGNTNPNLSEEELNNLVAQNMTEYDRYESNTVYNKGGRVGYDKGDMVLPMKKPQVNNLDDLPRGLQIDTTTSAYGKAVPEGTPIPEEEKSFKENLMFLNKIKGGVSPSTKIYMLKMYMDEALKKGQITKEQYTKMLMPFFGEGGENVTKDFERYEQQMNKGGLMRLNYMIGGEAKQMEAGAPPIMYSGNMDPNSPNQQAGLPAVPGPMQMAEDGPEFDMRENGGFQPLGRQEGKDDVPAMLAKNEFVMTADAVRAAGGGSIQKGAQKMYDTMKKLESRVS